jgi:hypothetical protein
MTACPQDAKTRERAPTGNDSSHSRGRGDGRTRLCDERRAKLSTHGPEAVGCAGRCCSDCSPAPISPRLTLLPTGLPRRVQRSRPASRHSETWRPRSGTLSAAIDTLPGGVGARGSGRLEPGANPGGDERRSVAASEPGATDLGDPVLRHCRSDAGGRHDSLRRGHLSSRRQAGFGTHPPPNELMTVGRRAAHLAASSHRNAATVAHRPNRCHQARTRPVTRPTTSGFGPQWRSHRRKFCSERGVSLTDTDEISARQRDTARA